MISEEKIPCAVFLRVGLDSRLGGIWGPIMNDRIFEFIPFPAYRGKNSPGLKDEGQLGKDLKIETYREVQ